MKTLRHDLEDIGGKFWSKDGQERVYLSSEVLIKFVATEDLSSNKKYKLSSSLDALSMYYDLNQEKFCYRGTLGSLVLSDIIAAADAARAKADTLDREAQEAAENSGIPEVVTEQRDLLAEGKTTLADAKATIAAKIRQFEDEKKISSVEEQKTLKNLMVKIRTARCFNLFYG